jgi:hypothetical protein
VAAARRVAAGLGLAEVATVAWALATLRVADGASVAAVAAAACGHVGALAPQGLSTTAWALAELGADRSFCAPGAAGGQAPPGGRRV